MKHLAAAFAMSGLAALILYLIASFMVSNHEACFGIAALPFVAVTHVFETLEREEVRRTARSTSGKAIPSYGGFTKSCRVAVTSATIAFVGVVVATNFLAGVWVAIFAGPSGAPFGMIIATCIPINAAAAFLVGSWLGARCESNGIGACFAVAAASSLTVRIADFMVIYFGDVLVPFTVTADTFIAQFLGGFVIFSVFLLLGYWRGRRNRQARYLAYLLGVLPENTRELLIALAHDEAQSLSANRAASRPPSIGGHEATLPAR